MSGWALQRDGSCVPFGADELAPPACSKEQRAKALGAGAIYGALGGSIAGLITAVVVGDFRGDEDGSMDSLDAQLLIGMTVLGAVGGAIQGAVVANMGYRAACPHTGTAS